MIFTVPASDPAVVAGNNKISPPKTADEILERIRTLSDHGDLADEEFYAEKLGVKMEGANVSKARILDQNCGSAMGTGI